MRILVIGASGFIGSHLVPALQARSHVVVCATRAPERLRRRFPGCEVVSADMGCDEAETWRPRLASTDAVINAAGALRGNLEALHQNGPIALFNACARAGIPHVMQISALGAAQPLGSRFLTTKAAADAHLLRLAHAQQMAGWHVLRPSLVIGRGGASTELFSALAAPPWPLRLGAGTWRVQPLHIADLVDIAVDLIARPAVPPVLELVGPDAMTTDELTAALRVWLGLDPRPFVSIPLFLLRLGARVGDFLPASPITTEAMNMLAHGNISDSTFLHSQLGFLPRPLPQALAAAPSCRADRWLARMLPVRAALIVTLGAVWVGSGLASFALPPQRIAALLAPVTHGAWGAMAITWAGATLDVLLGFALLLRGSRRRAAQAQLVVLLVYTILATIILPGLWADPFGSLLKNLGLLSATWAILAVED